MKAQQDMQERERKYQEEREAKRDKMFTDMIAALAATNERVRAAQAPHGDPSVDDV